MKHTPQIPKEVFKVQMMWPKRRIIITAICLILLIWLMLTLRSDIQCTHNLNDVLKRNLELHIKRFEFVDTEDPTDVALLANATEMFKAALASNDFQIQLALLQRYGSHFDENIQDRGSDKLFTFLDRIYREQWVVEQASIKIWELHKVLPLLKKESAIEDATTLLMEMLKIIHSVDRHFVISSMAKISEVNNFMTRQLDKGLYMRLQLMLRQKHLQYLLKQPYAADFKIDIQKYLKDIRSALESNDVFDEAVKVLDKLRQRDTTASCVVSELIYAEDYVVHNFLLHNIAFDLKFIFAQDFKKSKVKHKLAN